MNRPQGYKQNRDAVIQRSGSDTFGLQDARASDVNLVHMNDSTRGIAKTALGTAAVALGIGLGALGYNALGSNSGNERFSDRFAGFDDRISAIERRTEPVLDIRTYLLDGSCRSLGGQVAESNNDRQRNLTDCRFTQDQFGSDPSRFASSVMKSEYRDNMLRLADRPDDRTWDSYNSRNLERLLEGGYAGIIAHQAPQRAAPVQQPRVQPRTPTPERHTPTPTTQRQCATDVVNMRKSGFFGIGSVNVSLPINDCATNYTTAIHNITSGVCRDGFRVDGTFTPNPALYITQLNRIGVPQRFEVRCHYPPQTHSSGGGNGSTGGGINCGGDCGGSTGGRGGNIGHDPQPGVRGN